MFFLTGSLYAGITFPLNHTGYDLGPWPDSQLCQAREVNAEIRTEVSLYCGIQPSRLSSRRWSKRLRLTTDEYIGSAELHRWCERNRKWLYVPEWLLKEWKLEVKGIFSGSRNAFPVLHFLKLSLGLALTRTLVSSIAGMEFDAVPSILLSRIHGDIGFAKQIRHRVFAV